MRAVAGAAQVGALEGYTIDVLGLPGIALMELAAHGIARAITGHHAAAARGGTVVVCGVGNNGGDGYAVARILHRWGIDVSVWPVGPPKTPDAQQMAAIATRLGVPTVDGLGDAGLIVDAVFGTGLSRPITGICCGILDAIADHEAPVVAVDLPSGLDADRGRVLGTCPPATRTVTLALPKIGLYTGSGPDLAGTVEIVDLGLGSPPRPVAQIPDAADLSPRWPQRRPGDHKGRSGHLLVVAGSVAMAGAAVLTCRGAFAAGAGLVTLAVPEAALPRLAALPPEIMVQVVAGPGPVLPGLPDLSPYDAVAAGPGLGGGHGIGGSLARDLEACWRDFSGSAVFDADALPFTTATEGGRVLTPHPGEAARLLGRTVPEITEDRLGAVVALADRGVALLKGRHTLVADRGAVGPVSINPTGSPALATAGSGDVLTGLIGGLLARGVAPFDAARLGAWIHGRAGEVLQQRRRDGWIASDIAAAVPEAVCDLVP